MKRSTSLLRKTPVRRTGRLLPISKRRRAESKIYAVKRWAYLKTHPLCENFWCTNYSHDIHHKAGRIGSNFLNEKTWIALCRQCHDEVHRRPSEARKKGLLA